MALRIILISVVVLIGLAVVIPFVLNIAGIRVFEFGSIGGSFGGGTGEALLISRDDGDNWESARATDKKTSFPSQVLDLEFHPQNHKILYLGAKSQGLWISQDIGRSWKRLQDKAGVLLPASDVYSVAVSESNPLIIYLAVFQDNRGRVLKSEDGGGSFREVFFVTVQRYGVFDVWADPYDHNHILIVTGQGGLLESENGGSSWKVKRWFGEALSWLFVNPLDTGTIYVVTSSGKIFKSSDSGKNWFEINLESGAANQAQATYPPPGAIFNPFGAFVGRSLEEFILDPNIPSRLYAGSKEGLLRSDNEGTSWRRLPLLIPPEALPVDAIAVKPGDSNFIFAGASNQLHLTSDGGTNWRIKTVPTKIRIKKLLIHPLMPENLFAILGR